MMIEQLKNHVTLRNNFEILVDAVRRICFSQCGDDKGVWISLLILNNKDTVNINECERIPCSRYSLSLSLERYCIVGDQWSDDVVVVVVVVVEELNAFLVSRQRRSGAERV